MRVLLDTHTLLWSTLSPSLLSRDVRDLVSDTSNEILVSAAAAWEIATKVRSGKLAPAVRLERDFNHVAEAAGYTLLPISVADALRAGRLVAEHRDPFDRILAAQALTLDIPILSLDTNLDAFGIHRIW